MEDWISGCRIADACQFDCHGVVRTTGIGGTPVGVARRQGVRRPARVRSYWADARPTVEDPRGCLFPSSGQVREYLGRSCRSTGKVREGPRSSAGPPQGRKPPRDSMPSGSLARSRWITTKGTAERAERGSSGTAPELGAARPRWAPPTNSPCAWLPALATVRDALASPCWPRSPAVHCTAMGSRCRRRGSGQSKQDTSWGIRCDIGSARTS